MELSTLKFGFDFGPKSTVKPPKMAKKPVFAIFWTRSTDVIDIFCCSVTTMFTRMS